MSRRISVLLLITITLVGGWAVAARAGGGCHHGPSQGAGEVVELTELCFTPSTLRTEVGSSITFVNRDPVIHNVSAMEWGQLEDMHRGDRFTATFAEEGLYPYACTYHAGMTGVVVVGDGDGSGSGVALDQASPVAAVEDAGATPGRTSTGIGWAAAGAVIGATLAIALRRRRTT